MEVGVLDLYRCVDAFCDGVVAFSDYVPWSWIIACGAGAGHQYPLDDNAVGLLRQSTVYASSLLHEQCGDLSYEALLDTPGFSVILYAA